MSQQRYEKYIDLFLNEGILIEKLTFSDFFPQILKGFDASDQTLLQDVESDEEDFQWSFTVLPTILLQKTH